MEDGKIEYMPNPEVLIAKRYVAVPEGTFSMAIIVSDADS